MADDRVRKQLAHCYNSIEYLHGSQEYWTGDRAIKVQPKMLHLSYTTLNFLIHI